MSNPRRTPARILATALVTVAVGGATLTAAYAATITGSPGNDVLTGTSVRDRIDGRAGDDLLRGAGGNDVVDGGPGRDTLHGDAGSDTLRGGFDPDVVYGGAGVDTIRTQGSDRAFGEGHADGITLGSGNALARGGAADDFLFADGPGTSRLFGDAGNDSLSLGANAGAGKLLSGGLGDDILSSDSGGNTLVGGVGNDQIVSRLDGVIQAEDGDDTIIADRPEAPTEALISCGPGQDSLVADLADVVDADCEDVLVVIVGDFFDNVLTGTERNDDISALDGVDHVEGLAGNDLIDLGQGADSVDAGADDDVVFSSRDSLTSDQVACGPGQDLAEVDSSDVVASDCESVVVFDG